jgi:hypothetical protein
MSYLPQAKFGKCARCGADNTDCKKRGKDLVCLNCCNTEDTNKQIANAKNRNEVRSLHGRQKEMGNEEAADRSALIQDIDYVFSRIVRLRAADEHGNCVCYTCGSKKHWSMMQCGHFVKRGNMGLRFNFRNSRVQDKHCNEILDGNYEVYRQKLEEEQPGLAEQLEQEGREPFKYYTDELKQLLIDLRNKLKPLEAKFKIQKIV